MIRAFFYGVLHVCVSLSVCAGVEARGPQQLSSSITFLIAAAAVVILRQKSLIEFGACCLG